MFDMIDIDHVKISDTVTNQEELHFKLHHIQTNDGKMWLVAFTSDEEYRKGEAASIIDNFIGSMLEGCADMMECCTAPMAAKSYDLDIEPDDISVSDTVTLVW